MNRTYYVRYSPEIKTSIIKEYFSLFAGPYAAFLTHATNKIEALNKNTDITKQMERYDYGFTAGIGYNHHLSKKFLITPSFRSWVGLANTSNTPLNAFIGTKNISHSFQITIEKKF